MGLIKKELRVSGSIGERDCQVLFDTGASACFVREDVAKGLSQILKTPKPLTFRLGNEATITAEYTADGYVLTGSFWVKIKWQDKDKSKEEDVVESEPAYCYYE